MVHEGYSSNSFIVFSTHHSFSVTLFISVFALFYSEENKPTTIIVCLEVFVRRLRMTYVFSVGLGGCLLDRMCFFTYPRGLQDF